jgi:exopolyphosphatase/guanosine-5'-triphosphate,3'-diphosphate pyrophosphatase
VDIGGGSVEFIIANKEEILWLKSFEIGAQRLLDMFHTKDPIPKKNLHRLDAYLQGQLGDLRDAMQKFSPRSLVGSSGAFDTLSDIFQKKTGISVPLENTEYPLDITHVQKIHKELADMTREQRLQVPGMIPMRVDMIVVASRLIRYLIDEYDLETIRVSSHALKEGILLLIQEVLFTEHSTAIGS